MTDYAIQTRKQFIAGVITLDEKRRKAIAYLGEKWIMHPQYDINKHDQHQFWRAVRRAA